jgi:hypothetical protein
MNRADAKLLAPIIAAFGEGKEIQHQSNGVWLTVTGPHLAFSAAPSSYRIKPDTVKYRRYMYRGNGRGRFFIGLLHETDHTTAEFREKSGDFIRWIDKDWQEAEIEA